MKMKRGKEIAKALCFSIVLVLLSFSGALAQGGKNEAKRVKITGGELIVSEPVLILRDVGKGEDIIRKPSWCGSSALLFRISRIGVERIDLENNDRTHIISGNRYRPVNCSPDGKWAFIYYDRNNIDEEEWLKKDPSVREPFVPSEEAKDWLYRYNLKAGGLEKIGDIFDYLDPEEEWLSPDKKSLFTGNNFKPVEGVGDLDPELVGFSSKDWNVRDFVWFYDSSGVAAIIQFPLSIGVEVFGDDGWSASFELEPEYGEFFMFMKADNQKRVYFIGERRYRRGRMRTLYRCEGGPSGLSCDSIMRLDGFSYFEVLQGGDIVMKDNGCIKLFPSGKDTGECIVSPSEGTEIELIGISPDRRRLAFYERKPRKRETFAEASHSHDLYVSELKWNEPEKER